MSSARVAMCLRFLDVYETVCVVLAVSALG